MKRLITMLLFMLAVTAVNAQQRGFVCTGNNVNVRKGPGKNYGFVCELDNDIKTKVQMFKGSVAVNLGKRRNGFCYVRYIYNTVGEFTGWVSAQYLRPVTICSRCKGFGEVQIGDYLENCPKCKGNGYFK
ncbi:MAG: hypothetical protein IJ163_05540 [Bacteroidaceae bacterium]|jgi:uncharacterized protein YraI|nr:hypothetical protein [Bacteroidaceae bacterium]